MTHPVPSPGVRPGVAAARPRPISRPIKQRQQATWASGDFAVIGITLQIVGESLAEAADIRANERVIDVAAGNGNATLAAAHRFAKVTSTDYVPALLEKGRARAAAEGLQVDVPRSRCRKPAVRRRQLRRGALDLRRHVHARPCAAPRARCCAWCATAGASALANWTPEGFIGQLFKTIGAHVPPPAGLKSPALWGTEAHCVELFGAARAQASAASASISISAIARRRTGCRCSATSTGRRTRPLPRSIRPTAARWKQDILALLDRFNIGGRASLVVPAEYLEVVITKRSA